MDARGRRQKPRRVDGGSQRLQREGRESNPLFAPPQRGFRCTRLPVDLCASEGVCLYFIVYVYAHNVCIYEYIHEWGDMYDGLRRVPSPTLPSCLSLIERSERGWSLFRTLPFINLVFIIWFVAP